MVLVRIPPIHKLLEHHNGLILVTGTTGSGKSVFVNGLIYQLITKHDDTEVMMILIDPKRVEFSRFKDIPHILERPVYDLDHIRYMLTWATSEMNLRFQDM